jgi:multidrug efflux pump
VLENSNNAWQVYANDQAMAAKDYMPLIIRYATPGTYSSASAGALIASTANAAAGGSVSTKTVNGVTTTTITTSSGTTTDHRSHRRRQRREGAKRLRGADPPAGRGQCGRLGAGHPQCRLANGKPSVLLVLNRSPGANIIETVDRVNDILPQLGKMIPAAISMDV